MISSLRRYNKNSSPSGTATLYLFLCFYIFVVCNSTLFNFYTANLSFKKTEAVNIMLDIKEK